VIRLAGLARGIAVHYVSTTAVLAGLGAAGVREVTEDTPLAHPGRLRIGYVETKYVAEELLRNAGRAGLPVTIYRPLDITGSVLGAYRRGVIPMPAPDEHFRTVNEFRYEDLVAACSSTPSRTARSCARWAPNSCRGSVTCRF
jgi:nucleoside-diphosphate-sugar epimerase